ncbi:hypothetical protein HKD37_03G006923 [Glycine soja]
MNVGALISEQITSMVQSNSSRLGFPALITALCRTRGVDSDSLVFERLSPVINLAYIWKNCWNPDDPTIIIRGARRPRARPAETPSTSVTPPPARIAVAPSTPPPVDFQPPPDPIPTVEKFNEWVAWPRTQPPPHRDDEDPAAQVPHQPSDESSDSSTPEPLIRKRRVVVTQEVTTTPEKSPEATPEPPTLVADTTSPQ